MRERRDPRPDGFSDSRGPRINSRRPYAQPDPRNMAASAVENKHETRTEPLALVVEPSHPTICGVRPARSRGRVQTVARDSEPTDHGKPVIRSRPVRKGEGRLAARSSVGSSTQARPATGRQATKATGWLRQSRSRQGQGPSPSPTRERGWSSYDLCSGYHHQSR